MSQHWKLLETALLSSVAGLSRHVHTKHASIATLATLTRIKRRAASARRKLAMQLPLKVQRTESNMSGELGGKGLALDVCRPNNAVLRSWDGKVFPGEGVGFESARNNTFTGRHLLAHVLSFCSLLHLLLLAVPVSRGMRGALQAGSSEDAAF